MSINDFMTRLTSYLSANQRFFRPAPHAHKEIYCFQSLTAFIRDFQRAKDKKKHRLAILEVAIFISLDFACINRRCGYDFCGQILRYVKNKRKQRRFYVRCL